MAIRDEGVVAGSDETSGAVAERMIDAALRLREGLSPEQADIACRPFPDDDERQLWFYTPTDHGGLDLGQMTSGQHQAVHRLVATGLSMAGYVTAATIMGLENILDRIEGWREVDRRERFRDPELYFVTVFGDPSRSGPWAWRFGGHHISLHYLIMDGEVVAATPNFFGANPAESPLLGPHLHRPLAAIEDLGRDLFRSLEGDQRQQALLSPTAPTDLITGNRSFVGDGDHQLLRPGTRENGSAIDGASMDDGLSVGFTPQGIPTTVLGQGEIDVLRELIRCYLNRLPDALADRQADLVEKEFDKIRFGWAGSAERREPHYYRIQGERLFIEYDNTQNGANHIHAVWRDLANDFGGDVLARHYREGHRRR